MGHVFSVRTSALPSFQKGLYVMPKVIEEENYADWYKFYQQPGRRSLRVWVT